LTRLTARNDNTFRNMNYLAQQAEININPSGQFANLSGIQFADLISIAVQFVLITAALVFFFILILGGIKWITSGGDKGKTEGARSQITAALVGLVIVFAAWAIIQLIEAFFGVSILTGLSIPGA
jgi:hypothetical protein